MRFTLTNPSGPAAGRIPLLDELKGVAILLVIIYHAGGVLGWRNLLHADLGVDMFVILSGVGLALSRPDQQGPGAFLVRRLSRLLPAYWLALAAFATANYFVLGRPVAPFDLATHVLCIHGWFGDALGLSINDSFWFMTLIVALYVLYALLRKIESTGLLLLIVAAVSVAVSLAFFFTGQSGMFSHLGLRLPGFAVGILLGRFLRDGRLEVDVGVAFGAALLLFVYVPYTQGVMFHTVPGGLALLAAYACLLHPVLRASAGGKCRSALQFLGVHSLEIFLLHQPLIRDYNIIAQVRWFGVTTHTPGTLIVGMVVAFAVTLVIAVELRRLLQRFTR